MGNLSALLTLVKKPFLQISVKLNQETQAYAVRFVKAADVLPVGIKL